MRENTMSSSSSPQQLSKPKRQHLSVFLLLIPTSLLALALLHLSCYGLHILCLRPAAIQDKIPLQKLRLLQDSTPLLTPPKQKPNSNQFSIKASEFFRTHHCSLKFFMTWISIGADSFGPRELASIQSLFKAHPTACLLIVSDTLNSHKPIINILQAFRVSVLPPDFEFLFKNTPAEQWFLNLTRGSIHPGEVPLGQNLSNLLRLALLYKFGGVYVDTDVIILKSLSGLKNSIGAQAIDRGTGKWSRLNNAVMVFDRGHPLLYRFMEEFARTFDGSRWGHNGPYLVSRVARSASREHGLKFTVLPPPAFYPVGWARVAGLFRGARDGGHLKWVKAKVEGIRRESFALHLWNRQSRGLEVEEGSVVERIMMDCCVFCNSSGFGL